MGLWKVGFGLVGVGLGKCRVGTLVMWVRMEGGRSTSRDISTYVWTLA